MQLMAPRSAPLSICPRRTRRWRNARRYSRNANYISYGMHRNTPEYHKFRSGRADNLFSWWENMILVILAQENSNLYSLTTIKKLLENLLR
jgi:hypothetical protein